MTHGEVTFALIVGLISAMGLVCGSWLAARATDRAARSSREALEHQTVLASKAKMAEFRQAWINNLRDAMARFMALGVDTKDDTVMKMVEAAAKIQLFMNKKDERYPRLVQSMKDFSFAIAVDDRRYDSTEFVELCQDILKNEWEVLKKELLELNSVR
jgi:hypothetical protein